MDLPVNIAQLLVVIAFIGYLAYKVFALQDRVKQLEEKENPSTDSEVSR